MTVSEVVAEMLHEAGVRTLFGVPGGENIHFMEAARQRGIEYVLVKQEGNAAFMADMTGQLSGVPGVCLSTLGPGSTNLVNGVANALLDRSPMLAISAQVARHRSHVWTHQAVDHRRLFAPISKLAAEITPHNAAPLLRRALRVAVAPRPGPVHLELPGDVAADEARTPPLPLAGRVRHAGPPVAWNGDGADELRTLLERAERPLVVAGHDAALAGVERELAAFAEAWSLPVVTTAKAKGVVDEDHELFAGVLDMAAPQLVAELLERADRIVAVGFDAVELIKDWNHDAPVVRVDRLPDSDQVVPAELELIGDMGAILGAGAEGARPTWDPAELERHRSALRARLVDASTSRGLAPHRVVLACREAFPDETIVTTDVGSHKLLVSQLWRARRPRTVFQSNGLSAMGFAFPAAIAAAIAAPERPVLCLAGDGGFSMSLAELEVAAARGLDVTSVVLSDGALNRIQVKQDARGYPHTGTETRAGHFARVAEAFGVPGALVEDAAGLERALADARATAGPVVIEARIDPSEYTVQF